MVDAAGVVRNVGSEGDGRDDVAAESMASARASVPRRCAMGRALQPSPRPYRPRRPASGAVPEVGHLGVEVCGQGSYSWREAGRACRKLCPGSPLDAPLVGVSPCMVTAGDSVMAYLTPVVIAEAHGRQWYRGVSANDVTARRAVGAIGVITDCSCVAG